MTGEEMSARAAQNSLSTMSSFATLPPAAASAAITPFTVSIPESDLQDMKTLVRLSKVAGPTFENTHTGEGNEYYYGIDRAFIVRAKEVWEGGEYDWRKTEARINSFPNFMAKVTDDDGTPYDVHFVGLFSARKDAVPLMMAHGWPGNFLEFLPILSILKSKYTPETLPYNVVIPSLPGYAFSSAPVDKSTGTFDAARVVHKLMMLLGLKGYVAQGGDIGASVARYCVTHHEECRAAHVNMIFSGPPPSADLSLLTPLEQAHLARSQKFTTHGAAYAQTHATVPSTIGLVLSSSPVALLTWISEKLVRWSDVTPPLPIILDFVTLYYLTGTIARNLYSYREVFIVGMERREFPALPAGKMLGFSSFEREIVVPPRAWAEASVGGKDKLAFYRYHEAGGHFAALEVPEALLGDVDDFVGMVEGEEVRRGVESASL